MVVPTIVVGKVAVLLLLLLLLLESSLPSNRGGGCCWWCFGYLPRHSYRTGRSSSIQILPMHATTIMTVSESNFWDNFTTSSDNSDSIFNDASVVTTGERENDNNSTVFADDNIEEINGTLHHLEIKRKTSDVDDTKTPKGNDTKQTKKNPAAGSNARRAHVWAAHSTPLPIFIVIAF